MQIRLLSRASDLARIQAALVGRALAAHASDVEMAYLTRSAAGDRDAASPLTAFPTKGLFTADLSDALASGAADAVVHSWKDLPLEPRPDTAIVATLERADPRDVLLVRRDVAETRPSVLTVLSASPRRAWLLEPILPALLPWRIDRVTFAPVRGNIATRIARLVEGRGDALVVAKAALDRLLTAGEPFDEAQRAARAQIDRLRWMVLPVKSVPGAPAQGALAVEIASNRADLRERFEAISHAPTWRAVTSEREVLAAYGGGCHAAVGATCLTREFGRVLSVQARGTADSRDGYWTLLDAERRFPPADPGRIWPRPEERHRASRRLLDASQPDDDRGLWVSRAEALPQGWVVSPDRFVWAAGDTTWRKLANRGVWVHGSAEGLGDAEQPMIDALAGRTVAWHRLTHTGVEEPNAIATYAVDELLPDDLPSRTHFFWTSGTTLRRACERWPAIRAGWHSSGPGRTWQVLGQTMGSTGRTRVSLDYESWMREVIA